MNWKVNNRIWSGIFKWFDCVLWMLSGLFGTIVRSNESIYLVDYIWHIKNNFIDLPNTWLNLVCVSILTFIGRRSLSSLESLIDFSLYFKSGGQLVSIKLMVMFFCIRWIVVRMDRRFDDCKIRLLCYLTCMKSWSFNS